MTKSIGITSNRQQVSAEKLTRAHVSGRLVAGTSRAAVRAMAFAAMLLSSLTLFAQSPSEVLYRDDFQSYGTQQNPSGWVDTAIGKPGPVADGLYKTWPDPTQGNKAPNVVYGTKSASGKPEGRNPRIGTFSTLTTKEFDAKGRFEFSGRLIRTRDDGRIGVTFLSQYPNADKYYLLGLWSQPTSSKLTMQLFAFDKALEDPVNPLGDQSARLKGIRDTGVTLDVNTWYRFFIRVDDSDGKTKIAARVWKDGSSEPTSFQIEVEDDVAQRLAKGRIGLWTAVKGDSYIDEILAKSPIDHSGPTIQFFRRTTAGNVELATGFETNADVTPIIVATDDTDPNPIVTATLDGAPFTSGTTVTSEGTHVIVVRATDSLGNQSDGTVSFYIDKTAPTIVVFEGVDPLNVVTNGRVFDRDVSLNLQIDDLSSATVVATLDGQPFVPGTALAPSPLYGVEKHPHEFVATVRDRVGNETAVGPLHFTIDKTAPEVTITRDGAPFSGGGFNTAIALAATVQDLTPSPLTMTLNGQPYAPGTPIAVNRQHTITASATDLAGHTTTQSITFVINQNAPGVRIIENGEALPEGKYFKRPVNPKIEIDNSIPPSVQVTLDGSPWPVTLESVTGNIYLYSNVPIATDGTHTIAVVASDAAGNTTPASVTFTIDQVAPSLTILESGTPLADGAILGRDAIVTAEATDAIGPVTMTIKVDDQPFTSGNAITASGVYVVSATASDKAGNETSAGALRLTIDKNAPEVSLLESGTAFPVDHWFKRDVVPSISVSDLTAVTVVVTIDGATAAFTRSSVDGTTSIWSGPTVSTEDEHTIGVTVTDQVGLVTTLAPLHFWIDKTAPTITLATPAPSSVVVAATADLAGAADDAVSVSVGGRPATIDAATKRWSLTAVSLLEGSNTLAITGTDRAGNASTVTPSLILDTRGPVLQVLSPANGSCTKASDLVIQGTASDARLASVAVAVDGQAPVAAQLEIGAGTWSVLLPGIAQGIHQITVTSADSAGHTSNALLTVRVDRIQPVIEVTEGGASFALTRVNRAVSLFVRAVDADPSVALTLTLDGGSFVSGSVIAGEGSHTLVVSARDCAGNEEQKTVSFSIDLTAPVFTALSPSNGGTVGTMPSSVAGTVSSDATTVKLLAAGSPPIEAVVSNGSFTLPGVFFEEGTNRFTLHAADDAGNESSVEYIVTVRTALPVVEITENGTPIAPNALFNRDVTPTITSSDPDAALVATLDSASYSIGSAITTDNSHTLSATATDDLGHTGTKSVTFRIDKTAPAVVITAPAAGASIASNTVTVTGTAGDAASVTVNGVLATLSSGAFSATVALELGENVIVAVARDEAGNSGRAEVTVTRAGAGPAVVLLYPTDKSLTNRPQSEVRGRVITPANVQSVTIALGGQTKATLSPDAAGDFRATLVLAEGSNAISASSLGKDGKSATATVQVTADFTPPALKLLANAAELRDGARFAERAALSVELSDAQSSAPTLELTIDGNASTAPKTIDERGGHVVLATARDAAGNETRVERSFTIGSGTGATSDCRVTQLDPKAGSIIASNVTRIAGRTSAPGVKVGGIPAEVVDGSFCVSVELANEGLNTIEIVCTDASGNPLGDKVTHTLERVTGAPTVTITTPTEGQSLGKNATGTISVSGTVGPGVVSVTVNGVRKPLDTNIDTQRSFTVDGVRVATGLNIIAARAETSSMRTATATRRVVYFGDAAAIAITSPVGTVVTGASSIDVTGTWSNLDPTSLTPAVSTNEYNDTSGSFLVASVPLNPGSNRITVAGVDAAGLPVSTFVDVTRTAGVPSVSITEPSDNTYVAGDEVIVRGTAEAAVGSTVQVNGLATNATSEPAGEGRVRITFDASVHVSDSGAITPIVARVSEPGGGGSFDTIRVTRFAGAFAIRKDDENTTLVFPAMSAVQVPTTIQTLVAFTHAVDRASVVAGGVTLVAANGQAVSGVLRVDRDVVSFAPSAPLAEGESYTIKVASTVKDLAGTALGTPYESRFVTAITAPQTAPQVTTPPASVCGTTLGIDGTAVPNARVQLDSGSWQFTATASATGAFHFDLPLTGQSGYQLVRVRTVGTDGSLSPSADVCVRVDCGGTRVLGATYDTTANAISIVFSDAIDGSTLGVGGSIRLTSAAGSSIGGSVTLSTPVTAIVTPERNLGDETFTVTVTTSVKDASGNALTAPFSQTFFAGGGAAQGNPGDGYLTGEVYDAKTGRPLPGATVTLGAAASQATVPPASLLAVTDARGRYTIFVPEGAHTIEVSAPGYTTVWRQIVVPAGSGVVPIDVRLEERGEPMVVASGDLTLTAGGAPEVTTPVSLTVTSGSVTSGSSVTLTSVNAQSLAGLLPLGWSTLASAEVVVSGGANGRLAESGNRVNTRGARSVIPSAARDLQDDLASASAAAVSLTGTLKFTVDASAITAAAQSLTAVRYDAARDEWTVVSAAVTLEGNTASVAITSDGAYALVYADKGPGLVTPSVPAAGIALQGVTDPCLTAGACDQLREKSFTLNPRVVMPNQRTTAILEADSTLAAPYSALPPSGTAVQAYIDEELTLSDGSTITDPPFATDLILYRDLDGAPAAATFHLAPSKRATEVFLNVGYEHIRIHPYPGRLDRGTLIGSEGGRVPGDGSVTVDIPAGAAPEPVRAEVRPIANPQSLPAVGGFTIIAAFDFELNRATQPASTDLDGDGNPDPIAPVELLKSASATFSVPSTEARQLVLAEVVSDAQFTTVTQLAALCSNPNSAGRAATIVREGLPLDGIVREGHYLLLAAEQPIAFATGIFRGGTAVLPNIFVTSSASDQSGTTALGTTDLTNATGLFSIPVPSSPKQPFQLSMRHSSLGEGSAYTHTSSPAKDEIVPLGFVGFSQTPLTLDGSSVLVIENAQTVERPALNAREVSLTTYVKLDFSQSINAATASTAISLVETSTGAVVAGSVSVAADTVTWNIKAGDRLKPNSRYTLNVAPTLASTNGVPFSQSRAITFSTITQLLGGGVHPELISITIPNEQGFSSVKGLGSATDVSKRAVPPNAHVVAVRRGRDFMTQYQLTADANGAFEFQIGTAGGSDRVTTSDVVDLQVISGSAVIAVIRLTPFVGADGISFLAPPDLDTRFTTDAAHGSITLSVPAGAFDEPTLISASSADATPFVDVPNFATELGFVRAVTLEFDGQAKKRIGVEFAANGSIDPSKNYFLGVLGQSIRGPRVMVVDTVALANGKLTTEQGSASGKQSSARSANSVASPELATDVKSALLGTIRRGTYAVVDLVVPTGSSLGWASMSGLNTNLDLFWSEYQSLFAADYYIAEKRGSVVIPVPSGRAFDVVGVDSTTGLEAFSQPYAPIAPSDPGSAVPVPSPNADKSGPYPLFGTPFRVEVVDVPTEDVELKSVANFTIKVHNGQIEVTDDASNKLPGSVPVVVFDVTNGAIDLNRADGLRVPGLPGHRLVLYVGRTEVDPDTQISFVFSEPIFVGGATETEQNQFLAGKFRLQKATTSNTTTLTYSDVTSLATFHTDSGGRRVLIDMQSSLERGASYKLVISNSVADRSGSDGTAGLTIGQTVSADGAIAAGIPGDLSLYFSVRAPGGWLTTFDIQQGGGTRIGSIRDLALNGNLLLVSALEGGILAYDVDSPASITSATVPVGRIDFAGDHSWAVSSDHHGRVFATTLGPLYGAVREFHLEDLLGAPESQQPKVVSRPSAGAIVSIAPGTATALALSSSALLSDRAEAIPRKLQILIQDDQSTYSSLESLASALGGSASAMPNEPGFSIAAINVPMTAGLRYATQRVTVENTTLDLRWSANASKSVPAHFEHVIARPGDQLRVLRNTSTWGVISLFGYGVGVYDLDAIASNDADGSTERLTEQLRLTSGEIPSGCNIQPSRSIPDLRFSPEAAILTRSGQSELYVYGVDGRRGVLDLTMKTEGEPDVCAERSPTGLVLHDTPDYDHPRLARLHELFTEKVVREPIMRFSGAGYHHWQIEAGDNRAVRESTGPQDVSLPGARGSVAGQVASRDYILVPGAELGLLVVEAGGNEPPAITGSFSPLRDDSLVDVIWIPDGAYAVRAIPRTQLAVVVDGEGRVLLVDLSRLDERFDSRGIPIASDALFPTAENSLLAKGEYGVGAEDPRIVWKSQPHLVSGTLAPVVDPDTGMIYSGRLGEKAMSATAATDPRIQIKVDLGADNGLSEASGIVPLGLELPASVRQLIAASARPDHASLGAFRLELALPGGTPSALPGGVLKLRVQSESVPGAPAPDPLNGLPPAAFDLTMTRVVPQSLASELRHQRGFNRFVSNWIVALADPRASANWQWPNGTTPAAKAATGCYNCERPAYLRGNPDVRELYSSGRVLAITPNPGGADPFEGTKYSYLGKDNRLTARFASVQADSVRPIEVLTAAQNAPVADGALQTTVYLHSGETSSSSIDLDAGGRNGWNVAVDRTYRSRTIGGSPLGEGWDSSIFRRLRALPNGDVEYRDGSGEVWRFVVATGISKAAYVSPRGVFARLARTDRGWSLIDQKWRVSQFDEYGRLTSESDEWREAKLESAGGNVIRYLYDFAGRLSQIVDPVGRVTTLTYEAGGVHEGLLATVSDWRGRSVAYHYESGRLTSVELPEVRNTRGSRPTIRYAYQAPGGSSLNDRLELANLWTITDPQYNTPRVTLNYGSGADRDRVRGELWTTGDTTSFTYPATGQAHTTDALGQNRDYSLTAAATDFAGDRTHIATMTETAVPVSTTPFGTLPAVAAAGIPNQTTASRTWSFRYDTESENNGLLGSVTLEGIRKTTYAWKKVEPEAPGFVLASTKNEPVASVAGKSSSMNLSDVITREIKYRTEPYRTTLTKELVASVGSGGVEIKVQSPQWNGEDAKTEFNWTNEEQIKSSVKNNPSGQVTRWTASGGTQPGGTGSTVSIDYEDATSEPHKRSLPKLVDRGGVVTKFDYPNQSTIVETDPRGIKTTTYLDAWRRPEHVVITGSGQLTIDQTWSYDANGRVDSTARKQGADTVTTKYDYDALGRTTKVTTDNVAVDGAKTSVSTTSVFNLAGRTITTTNPKGSVTTTELDRLGRSTHTTTTTGGTPIESYFSYDLLDNPVFTTDLLTASAAAFDVHGRLKETLAPEGTRNSTDYDAWDRPISVRALDAANTEIAHSSVDLSPGGEVEKVTTKIDELQSNVVERAWDGAGATAMIASGGAAPGQSTSRRRESLFDEARRLITSKTGEGGAASFTEVQTQTSINASDYAGFLPKKVSLLERGNPFARAGDTYETSFDYDNAGNQILQKTGNLESSATYNERGDLKSFTNPSGHTSTTDRDAFGRLTQETRPDGAVVKYTYDALGAPNQYSDETNEGTTTTTDLIGRPTLRTYKDATTEVWTYEGSRLTSYKDRQGRLRTLVYNDKGQVISIQGNGNLVLEKIDYDLAGRVVRRANKDAAIEYDEFNLAGQPRLTRQVRYANESGVNSSPQILDRYEQRHAWNVHGERSEWSMPEYSGVSLSGGWTRSVGVTHDAMGNVEGLSRTLWGATSAEQLMTARFRNVGRPDVRTINTSPTSSAPGLPVPITRSYGYDSATGQLKSLAIRAKDTEIAGTLLTYEGLQVSHAQLLGLSDGERSSDWSYDARGRLATNTTAKHAEAAVATNVLSPADFRSQLSRPETTPASPKSMVLTELPGGGHKIDEVTKGDVRRKLFWDGSELDDDGSFVYSFDTFGRLVMVTEKSQPGTSSLTVRRIKYDYAPSNRLVGRRAEYATIPNAEAVPLETDWKIEDRADILAADALPAATTFVWDPFGDTVVSIFKAGASQAGSTAGNGGLVRQIINGGLSYDDPIEVTAVDPNSASGTLTRLYPVYDEAGTGSLQAILNASGEMVARTFTDGAYGEDEYALSGPAVEKIAIEATKDQTGSLASINIKLRLTEPVNAATLAAGLRLAVIDAGGSVLRSSAVSAQQFDDYTAGWTLSGPEWSSLVEGGAALSIGATNALRANGWADAPVIALPQWATGSMPVYSSTGMPVEARESIPTLRTWIDTSAASATNTRSVLEIPDLAALAGSQEVAGDPRALLVNGTFQAQPFHEPLTGKNYVRNRWYDPSTGTFLTPDPLGYQDSSNLYAFCGGDPVNRKDPTGKESLGELVHGWTEQAFDSGNGFAITGAVLGETVYAAFEVASVGAVGKIDKAQEDLDRGKITHKQYWKRTGVAVTQTVASYTAGAAGGALTARAAGALVGARGTVLVGTLAGATGGISAVGASDAVGIGFGTQQSVSSPLTYASGALIGAAFGTLTTYSTSQYAVKTPQGYAVQSPDPALIRLQQDVAGGRIQIFRGGNFPDPAAVPGTPAANGSYATEGQYWGFKNPLDPTYAASTGAANLGSSGPQFVMAGTARPGVKVIVRPAPAYGTNPGGAPETVIQPSGVLMDFFSVVRW